MRDRRGDERLIQAYGSSDKLAELGHALAEPDDDDVCECDVDERREYARRELRESLPLLWSYPERGSCGRKR